MRLGELSIILPFKFREADRLVLPPTVRVPDVDMLDAPNAPTMVMPALTSPDEL